MTQPPSSSPTRRVVGYYSSWSVYARDYQVSEIPAAKLTHVIYAFAKIASGGCVMGDTTADGPNFDQLRTVKINNPNLSTLIAIGGYTWSGGFSDAALTDTSRRRFATSCADFMQRYGFDGIDIDWEYPVSGGLGGGRPEDKRNYTLLMQTLRSELDARGLAAGRRYLLTAATPAAAWSLDNFEIANLAPLVDFLNVMTYDFHGSWENRTGFNAPLYAAPGDPTPAFNSDSAVNLYLGRGVPASRINLGLPLYGRGWTGVPSTNNGLFQSAIGTIMGTAEQGMWDYADLAANRVPTMTRFWNSASRVPYLYDATTGLFITYDDPESITAKVRYAEARGLGGVMMWDLGADDRGHSLVAAAATFGS